MKLLLRLFIASLVPYQLTQDPLRISKEGGVRHEKKHYYLAYPQVI